MLCTCQGITKKNRPMGTLQGEPSQATFPPSFSNRMTCLKSWLENFSPHTGIHLVRLFDYNNANRPQTKTDPQHRIANGSKRCHSPL
jgi:hypothetical protein